MCLVGLCFVATTKALKPHVGDRASLFQPKVKKLSLANDAALGLRGGAIDSDAVAKASILLQVANAAFIAAFPAKSVELYKSPPSAPNTAMLENIGFALLTYAVEVYMMYFENASLTYAAGMGSLAFAVQSIKSIVTQHTNGAASVVGDWMKLACSCVMAFAGLTKAEYAGTLLKIFTGIAALSGLQLVFDPSGSAKAWNVQLSSPSTKHLARACGAFMLGYSTFRILIMRGMDVKTAFGWSILTHTLFTGGTVVDLFGEAKGIAYNKPAYVIWSCIHLFTAASLVPK